MRLLFPVARPAASSPALERRLFLAAGVLTILLAAAPAFGQVRIEGRVVDGETYAPLAGAHVMVVGTTIGAVTNAEGRFALSAPDLPVALRIRHVGYETGRMQLDEAPLEELTLALEPAVIQLEEIMVSGETFAEHLMRRVIAEKQRWSSTLRTYRANGFSRVNLERDGRIMHVSDAMFDQYWDRTRGPRAVVAAYSSAADWYDELPLESAAYVPNFYADRVALLGLEFVGPTHPDALARYTFRLAGQQAMGEQTLYDLYVSPADERHATFIGKISVLDSAFALVRTELRPARHVAFPAPVDSWAVTYVQHFEHVDEAWLPVDLQADGDVAVASDAQRRRTFEIHARTQLSHFRINTALPLEPFEHAGPVVHDRVKVLNDPMFRYGSVVMPLTAREAEALERLRTEPPSLREAFPPAERRGRWSAFLEGSPESMRIAWPTVMGYEFRFRYNRVDGLYSSVGNALELTPGLEFEWRLGQATGLTRVRYHVRARRRLGAAGFAEIDYRRDTRPRLNLSRYSPEGSSIQSLLGGDDYFDYYWVDGGSLQAGVAAGRFTASVGFTHEAQRSVDRQVSRSWPFGERFRPNPEIESGTYGSTSLTLRWSDPRPSTVPSLRLFEARIENAPGLLPGTDFRFTQFRLDAEAHLPTLFRRRPAPAALDVRLTLGTAAGSLPPQRFAALDGSLDLADAVHVGRLGTFRTLHGRPLEGERHVGVFWEHDFSTWPFEWGLFWPLARRGMGLSVFGAHGRTWIADATLQALPFSPSYRNALVHEIGLSVTRLGGSPIRIDLGARLDAPGFAVGVGLRMGRR